MIFNPSVSFLIIYANKLFNCRAIMQDKSYLVFFNGSFTVEIANNFEGYWTVEDGTILPFEIINRIGDTIEHYLS